MTILADKLTNLCHLCQVKIYLNSKECGTFRAAFEAAEKEKEAKKAEAKKKAAEENPFKKMLHG
jgi:hypothetical protein